MPLKHQPATQKTTTCRPSAPLLHKQKASSHCVHHHDSDLLLLVVDGWEHYESHAFLFYSKDKMLRTYASQKGRGGSISHTWQDCSGKCPLLTYNNKGWTKPGPCLSMIWNQPSRERAGVSSSVPSWIRTQTSSRTQAEIDLVAIMCPDLCLLYGNGDILHHYKTT